MVGATQLDVDLLYEEDRDTYERIEEGQRINVTNIMAKLRNKVRSRTRAVIYKSLDLYFVGAVPGASGQGGTLVQYVTYHTQTLVAKIATSAKLDRDVEAASRVFGQRPPAHTVGVSPPPGPPIQWPAANIPTVMPILAVLRIPRNSKHPEVVEDPTSPTDDTFVDERPGRMAIICPVYAMSVASLRCEEGMRRCTGVTIANVALCVLAAIKAFDQVGLIHGDIKPDNLLLNLSRGGEVVLIDFGSAVEHGAPLLEWSPPYPLGVTTTTVEYDLACLAAVLFELGGGYLEDWMTVQQVIPRSKGDRLVDKLVRTCLDAGISAEGGIDAVWRECKAACVEEVGGQEGFIDVERIWPVKD